MLMVSMHQILKCYKNLLYFLVEFGFFGVFLSISCYRLEENKNKRTRMNLESQTSGKSKLVHHLLGKTQPVWCKVDGDEQLIGVKIQIKVICLSPTHHMVSGFNLFSLLWRNVSIPYLYGHLYLMINQLQ